MSQLRFVNSLSLKSIVQAFVEEEVMIKSYTVEPASRNNSTLAEIYRVFAQYSSDSTKADVFRAVAKVKPITGSLAQEFQSSDAFEKELFMYRAVLPKLVEALKGTVKINFSPSLIFTLSTPTDVIFLEDLSDIGFSPESPSIGLNENQARFALEKLAFFHAASAIKLSEQPELFSRFERGTFHQDFVGKLHYFVDALKFLIDNGRNLGLDDATIVKLQSLPGVLTKRAIDIYNDPNVGFKVLNHGDFNTSNILFKYNSQGELEDCAFVDYQNCFVGSPVIDLIFFLTSSVEPSVLAEKRDELIYAYYEALNTVLNNLGYKGKRLSLLDLQIELLKKGALEVIFTLTAAPYLRAADKKIVPALIPSLHNDQIAGDLKSAGIGLLKENKVFLLTQLERFESLGLLEWGAAESKVKGLLNRFQGIKLAA